MKKISVILLALILGVFVRAPSAHAFTVGLSTSLPLLFPSLTTGNSSEHEVYTGAMLELTNLDKERTSGVYFSFMFAWAVTPPVDYESEKLIPPLLGMTLGFGISAYNGERLSIPVVLAFHSTYKDAADARLFDIGILGKLAFRVKTDTGLAFVFQSDISFDMMRYSVPNNKTKTTTKHINILSINPGIGLQYTF